MSACSMILPTLAFLLLPVLLKADLCDDLAKDALSAVSKPCLEQLEVVCKNGSLLWKMVDASSKYPTSGMMYGSNMDFANFDECMDINHDNGAITGKFCTWSLIIINPNLPVIPMPFSALNAKSAATLPEENFLTAEVFNQVRNALTDQIFATGLSMCIPNQCTLREVGKFFVFGSFEETQLLTFSETVPCVTQDSYVDFDGGEIAFTFFLALVGLLIVASTAYDFYLVKMDKKPYNPVLLAFSLITNVQKLIHTSSGGADQIGCLHGLRFISMMWIIAGHGYVAMKEVPVINYATVIAYQDKMGQQYIASAPIAVDTFFLLSGFLLAFGYLKSQVKLPVKQQVLSIPMMIVHRYLRLTPALAVAYFASITIFRKLGLGPLWGIIVTNLKTQCLDNWWQFFLYIQNYTSYTDMCLNHTWYLSADMQMFILAPLVLIPITIAIKKDKVKLAMICLCVLTFISVVIPMAVRYADHTIANVYDSHSRFGDYLIGMMLGVVMRHPLFKKFPFGKLTNLAIWCFVLNACVAFNLYYHNILRIYDHTSDTTFYGLYRPIWCFSLFWMIYSCHHGHGGVINWFLSLPAFQIGGRLSYCMYLLHAIIQMYWVGLIRTQYYWGDYMIFYIFCGHFVVTIILSVVWTLAFESPIITLEKFIFGGLYPSLMIPQLIIFSRRTLE